MEDEDLDFVFAKDQPIFKKRFRKFYDLWKKDLGNNESSKQAEADESISVPSNLSTNSLDVLLSKNIKDLR